jgi:HKD family nuclease
MKKKTGFPPGWDEKRVRKVLAHYESQSEEEAVAEDEVSVLKLDVIENNGPDNLRDALKSELRHVSRVSIAVAFVTQAGLDEILQPLRQVAANGSVRFLTGLYQKVTEPQALKTLLRVQEETRGRFSVRLSREPQFHRKLYLLDGRGRAIVIIGSSNLTREGLRSGGELNLILRLPRHSSAAKKMADVFEDDWTRRAVPLLAEQIREYEKDRPEDQKRETYTRGRLCKILGTPPSHRRATDKGQDMHLWRDAITGLARKRTAQLISETTNWDDKKHEWYSVGGAHPYKIGDRILLFDFYGKRIKVVTVCDIACTKVLTPDGRQFVAYRPLRGYDCRFSERLWTALKEAGIHRKNARGRRKIGPKRASRLMILMREAKRRK